MSHVVRTTVTLHIDSALDARKQLLEFPSSLQQIAGVEEVELQQELEGIPSVTLKVRLVGTTKAHLRRTYNRISKIASQSPLMLRSRTCNLSDLFD